MINLKDGWYVQCENGNATNYMSKKSAEEISNRYNDCRTIDEGSAYLKYDKDFDLKLVEDDLISYGLFKGDFQAIVKQSDIYILFVIVGAPECNIANIPEIINFIEECEVESLKCEHIYKYKESFETVMGALEVLNKVC